MRETIESPDHHVVEFDIPDTQQEEGGVTTESREAYERARAGFLELIDHPNSVKLGFGAEADVFSVNNPDQPFCVKRSLASDRSSDSQRKKDHFPNTPERKLRPQTNSPAEEVRLQEQAHRLGLNVPWPFFHAITPETDDHYIVMEKIRGSSVHDIIEQGLALPVDFDVERFEVDLLDQLRVAHTHGLYHRDLHAKNVMIDQVGRPVIIDFGLAVLTAHYDGGDDITNPYEWTAYTPGSGGLVKLQGDSDESKATAWLGTLKKYCASRRT